MHPLLQKERLQQRKKELHILKLRLAKKHTSVRLLVNEVKSNLQSQQPTTPSAPVNPPAEPTATPTTAPSKTPVLSATSLSMRKGEYYQLSVQDPKHLPVWTSSNKNIAEVDSQGKVHAINVGTTEIKVDAGIVLTCTVTVTMETSLRLNQVLSKAVIKGQRSVRMKLANL